MITQIHTVVISFIVANLVIENKLTLGAMLAIQFIMGQLFGPIQQWIVFIQSAQDAKIGLERLNEIHQLDEEENKQNSVIRNIGNLRTIHIKQLSFAYPGAANETVLKNINLEIPQNNVIAIVGTSGSGKTTLLKLLLKIYDKYSGSIHISSNKHGNLPKTTLDFAEVSHSYWRSICGCVLQDGYIFNDSIAKNIAVSGDEMNYERLIQSCQIANIQSFIESLPNGFDTNLGSDGMGISQGQKQRILIARAVYKNPEYLFFDEATNALDANNEMAIVDNLTRFFEGRTVIIVAHRLSTVKHADKIIVLDKGIVVEEGTHAYLTSIKGKYYKLVKNQLELGN
jgi:ATP-binding cassette subfamily B protein